MKKIQRIILAFMLGIMPLQSALADSKATELVLAAGNGNLEQVKTLIEKEGVDINARETRTGATALIGASIKGELEVVKYLIDKGADINAKIDNGRTALIIASMKGHLEVVKYLVDKGADINAKDNDGKTALMEASMNGYLDIVKALVEGKKGLLSMFSKGADINAKDNCGVTALMEASGEGHSGEGHLEIVQYLINKGAKVNAKGGCDEDGVKSDGITALIAASMKGHLEVVKYLISKGANVNVVMTVERGTIYRRLTALDVAKIDKHYKIAEVLRNAGAKSAKEIKK